MGLINYKDKVCVVTGAASGIGLATVKLLLEEGAKVYAMDLYSPFFMYHTIQEENEEVIKTLREHVDLFMGNTIIIN